MFVFQPLNESTNRGLTNTAQDPVTKMPELKACAVRVEQLEGEG